MQKYVSLKPVLKLKPQPQFIMLLGERSNGKSYCTKEHVLKEYKKNGTRFIYLRRYQIETKPSYVEGYFRDAPIRQIFDEWEFVTCYRGGVYLARMNDDGKTERGDLIGYTAWLSGESHFKSQNFNDVSDVIFEEFITSDGYIYDEVRKLESFISTVARRRSIRVFLIGNTISRLCPYFSEWGLTFIPKMEQGTVRVCEHHTDQVDESGNPVVVRIAVYFCENSGNNSKMFFGATSKMITTGAWQTKAYQHLPYRYRECSSLYSMLYEYREFCFKIEALKTPSGLCLFIHPHTAKRDGFRIVTDRPTIDPKSSRDFTTVSRGDVLIRRLYDSGKVYFSDNLTGEDFHSILADKGEF